jgi:hypothetical protein
MNFSGNGYKATSYELTEEGSLKKSNLGTCCSDNCASKLEDENDYSKYNIEMILGEGK